MSVLREALLLCSIQSGIIRALSHWLLCVDACSLVLILGYGSLDYLLPLVDFLIKILLGNLWIFKFLIWQIWILSCRNSSWSWCLSLRLNILAFAHISDLQVRTLIVLDLGRHSSSPSLILVITRSHLILSFLILSLSIVLCLPSATSSILVELLRWHIWTEVLVNPLLLSLVQLIILGHIELIRTLDGVDGRLVLLIVLVASLANALITQSPWLLHILWLINTACQFSFAAIQTRILFILFRWIGSFLRRLSPCGGLYWVYRSAAILIHVLLGRDACSVAHIFGTESSKILTAREWVSLGIQSLLILLRDTGILWHFSLLGGLGREGFQVYWWRFPFIGLVYLIRL